MKAINFITYSFLMISIAFIIRLVGYFITGNLALALESAHIVIDFIITIFILVTLRVISSEFSGRFSYGLFKLEDLISLSLAILVAFTGIEFLISGFLSRPSMALDSSLIQGLSVIPIALAAHYKLLAGKEINSPSLESDGRHTYTDFYEGLGVSAGLFLSYYFGPGFYYLSLIIAFLALMFTSYSIGRDSILSLLDLPKEKGVKNEIEKIVSSVDKVRKVKEVRLRWAGPVIFVELVVEMDPLLTIDDAHPVTEEIEKRVRESVNGIYHVTVHVEPVKRKSFRVIIPSEGREEGSMMDQRLAKANYFAIVNIDEKISYEFIENPFREKDELAGLDFKDFLVQNGISDIICSNVGEITFGLMLSYGIYCWHSDPGTISEIIKKFINGDLKKLQQPTKRSKAK